MKKTVSRVSFCRFRCERREHGGKAETTTQAIGRATADHAKKAEKEDLPTVPAVRGLQGGRIQRLDPSAAGLRRVLLSRRMHIPVGQPHERVQPRGHADPYELGEPVGRAEGVLRAHEAEHTDAAVRRRRGQVGGQKLSRNGRRGMRVQIKFCDVSRIRVKRYKTRRSVRAENAGRGSRFNRSKR